ncbi:MAG: hypothetical protein ACLUNZ_06450 [Evtepia sp.]
MQNKRIVVKVGTSTLSHPSGLLNIRRVEELCKVLSDLKNAGNEIILVSSGAIGMGVGKLSLPKRPEDMPTKQAAAAVGQCELMLYLRQSLWGIQSHGSPDPAHCRGSGPARPAPQLPQHHGPSAGACTPCPSSTKTTPWLRKKLRSATTTPWPPASP